MEKATKAIAFRTIVSFYLRNYASKFLTVLIDKIYIYIHITRVYWITLLHYTYSFILILQVKTLNS